MFVAAAVTVILKTLVAVPAGLAESLTLTVKLKVPVAVGVPEIAPVLVKLRPAGKEPLVIDQLYGVVPPLAASVAE
jgi:hypothetical protein